MSGNPNMQKIGKRKMAPGKKQPDWLFPGAGKPTQPSNFPNQSKRSSNKQEKKFAESLLQRRAAGEPLKPSSSVQLLELVGAFLTENEFMQTSRTFLTERKSGGERSGDLNGVPSLSTIYQEWRELKAEKIASKQNGVKQDGKLKIKSTAITNGDSDSDEDSSEESDIEMLDAAPPNKKHAVRKSSSTSPTSSSESDSDADDENEAPISKSASPKPKANVLKRKAPSSTSSSSSDSDSSSENEGPRVKKAKITATATSDSDSSSSDSDSSSDEESPRVQAISSKSSSSDSESSSSDSDSTSGSEDETPKVQNVKAVTITSTSTSDSDSSDSDSDSDSDLDSDSDSSTQSIAKNVPLPASDDDSSGSDSDTPKKKIKKEDADSSVTLSDAPKKTPSTSDSSSDSSSSIELKAEPKVKKVTTKVRKTATCAISPPLPPNPVIKPSKKAYEPFSRIPKDIKIDERLASNKYVPYDYAQKAHEDLIVTKGKGFTKEKNKKKRGSYRGGYIDVESKKGIKFED